MSPEQRNRFAGCYYSQEKRDVLKGDGSSAGMRLQTSEIFRFLAENSDRVVSRQELSDKVWGEIAVTDDSLTKCISEIRNILGDDQKTILNTLPKRGYQLVADEIDLSVASDTEAHHLNAGSNPTPVDVTQPPVHPEKSKQAVWLLLLSLLAMLALYRFNQPSGTEDSTAAINAGTNNTEVNAQHSDDRIPHLAIRVGDNSPSSSELDNSLIPELRVELNRYRTIELVSTAESDIELLLRRAGPTAPLTMELTHRETAKILLAESYSHEEIGNNYTSLARRIASSVASPGVGAVDSYLLESSRLIPPEQMSKAACYAHGYGCSKCSGEEDNVTRRAEACLAALLKNNPDDGRAWALQATIHAHQYWWANTLPEPMRSDPALRTHLPIKAIQAANKAESLSDGNDTAVYWGNG